MIKIVFWYYNKSTANIMILCGLCNARGKKCKRNNASFVSPIAWPLKTTDISSKMTDIFSPYSERKKEKNERMEG